MAGLVAVIDFFSVVRRDFLAHSTTLQPTATLYTRQLAYRLNVGYLRGSGRSSESAPEAGLADK